MNNTTKTMPNLNNFGDSIVIDQTWHLSSGKYITDIPYTPHEVAGHYGFHTPPDECEFMRARNERYYMWWNEDSTSIRIRIYKNKRL